MDTISSTFSALADPTRRAILARLAMGETSVTELAAPFEMSMPAVSKHLRVLEKAGLVERGREAQFRPCRLRAEPLGQATEWLEQYRRFWEESFDRLDVYLQRLQAAQAAAGPKAATLPESPPASPPGPGKKSRGPAKSGAKDTIGRREGAQRKGDRPTSKDKETKNGSRSRNHA